MRHFHIMILLSVFLGNAARAEVSPEVCQSLLSWGVFDTNDNLTDKQKFSLVKNAICSQKIETSDDAKRVSGSIGVNVFEVVGINLGGNSDDKSFREKKDAFCRSDYSAASSSDFTMRSTRTASAALTRGFVECTLGIANIKGLAGAVRQDSNKKTFAITISYRDGAKNEVDVTNVSARPAKLKCDRNLQDASLETPIKINGSAIFVCENLTPDETVLLGITTNQGVIGPNNGPYTLVGQKDVMEDIGSRLQLLEGRATPTGLVAFFHSNACPIGWSEESSLAGRYVVGLAPGGTLGAPIGIKLEPNENRPAGAHTHAHNTVKMSNRYPPDGAQVQFRHPGGGLEPVGSWRTDEGGLKQGTNAPYLQLLACKKL